MSEKTETRDIRCPLCELLDRLRRSEAGRHLLTARREVLLAMRACLDRRINFVEQLLGEEPAAQNIKVE